MPDVFRLLISFLAGVAAGVLFFEGLWWTVSRVAASHRPVRLLLISFLLRAAAAVSVLALMLRAGLAPLAVGMCGFLAGRTAVIQIHRKGSGVAS
jgi:F1F0 ATPase subunit 2